MNTNLTFIKRLREETGAGVQDCRKALEQSGSMYEVALDSLRQKAAADALKRGDRKTAQGIVELYSHGGGRIGVMVEVNTETDFASRSPVFHAFAHEVALQIAAAAPEYIRAEDIPEDVLAQVAAQAATSAQSEGKSPAVIPRIVEGRLNKFKNERILLRQSYIRDEKVTIAELLNQVMAETGENVVIRRFVRWEMNEGAEQG